MKSVIKLSFKELEPKKIDSSLIVLEGTGVIVHDLKLGDGNHLFQIVHTNLNTMFHLHRIIEIIKCSFLTKTKNLYGATYVIDRGGSYMIQTRCKVGIVDTN